MSTALDDKAGHEAMQLRALVREWHIGSFRAALVAAAKVQEVLAREGRRLLIELQQRYGVGAETRVA